MTNIISVAPRPKKVKPTHRAMLFDGTNLTEVAWFVTPRGYNYINLCVYANGYVTFTCENGKKVEFRKGEFLVRKGEADDVVSMSAHEFHRNYTEEVDN